MGSTLLDEGFVNTIGKTEYTFHLELYWSSVCVCLLQPLLEEQIMFLVFPLFLFVYVCPFLDETNREDEMVQCSKIV